MLANLKFKLIGLAALAALSVGTAHAVPFTWTADAWNPNKIISSQLSHTFSILDEGFRPGVDTISTATFRVWLQDDANNDYWWSDGNESVKFSFDGGAYSSARNIDGSVNFSLPVPTNLLLDGLLAVIVRAQTGDFKLLSASLTVTGNRRTTAVPEPGTLTLLGLGLLGLAWAAKRRRR